MVFFHQPYEVSQLLRSEHFLFRRTYVCIAFCDKLLSYLCYDINQNHKYQQLKHCGRFSFGICNISATLPKFWWFHFCYFIYGLMLTSFTNFNQPKYLPQGLPPLFFFSSPHPTPEEITIWMSVYYTDKSVTQNMNKIHESL